MKTGYLLTLYLASIVVAGLFHLYMLNDQNGVTDGLSKYCGSSEPVVVEFKIAREMDLYESLNTLNQLDIPLLFGKPEKIVVVLYSPETKQKFKTKPYDGMKCIRPKLSSQIRRQLGRVKKQILRKTDIEEGRFYIDRAKRLVHEIKNLLRSQLSSYSVCPEYAVVELTSANGLQIKKIRMTDWHFSQGRGQDETKRFHKGGFK